MRHLKVQYIMCTVSLLFYLNDILNVFHLFQQTAEVPPGEKESVSLKSTFLCYL